MKRNIIGQMDDQGEVHEGLAVIVTKRWKNGFYSGWFAMGQEAMMALAKSDLGLVARRVLDYLLAKLDFENRIIVKQSVLAKDLGLHPSNVNAAIRDLISEGVIGKLPDHPAGCYRLNPNYGWKGSAKSHVVALKDYRPLTNP